MKKTEARIDNKDSRNTRYITVVIVVAIILLTLKRNIKETDYTHMRNID